MGIDHSLQAPSPDFKIYFTIAETFLCHVSSRTEFPVNVSSECGKEILSCLPLLPSALLACFHGVGTTASFLFTRPNKLVRNVPQLDQQLPLKP